MVPCIHCRALKVRQPFLFRYEECVSAITLGRSYVLCSNNPNNRVRLALLAPDVAFAKIPVIETRDIDIMGVIGKGGFGVVRRGTWQSKDVAIKELRALSTDTTDAEQVKKFEEFQREVKIMRYQERKKTKRKKRKN